MGSGDENEIGIVMLSVSAEALSEAKGKHLVAYREKPFAALRVTTSGRSWSFNFINDPFTFPKSQKSHRCV